MNAMGEEFANGLGRRTARSLGPDQICTYNSDDEDSARRAMAYFIEHRSQHLAWKVKQEQLQARVGGIATPRTSFPADFWY